MAAPRRAVPSVPGPAVLRVPVGVRREAPAPLVQRARPRVLVPPGPPPRRPGAPPAPRRRPAQVDGRHVPPHAAGQARPRRVYERVARTPHGDRAHAVPEVDGPVGPERGGDRVWRRARAAAGARPRSSSSVPTPRPPWAAAVAGPVRLGAAAQAQPEAPARDAHGSDAVLQGGGPDGCVRGRPRGGPRRPVPARRSRGPAPG